MNTEMFERVKALYTKPFVLDHMGIYINSDHQMVTQ